MKETTANQPLDQHFDLHDILFALGERAMNSTWLGSGVECFGENADELYTLPTSNQSQGMTFFALHRVSIRQLMVTLRRLTKV